MAAPAGRIEKEVLFKTLFEEKLPIVYRKGDIEYILLLEHPAGEELVFRPDRPMGKLKIRSKLPLFFNYRGHTVDFTVDVLAQKDDLVFCKPPEMLSKNPERGCLRVDSPSDLKIILTFRGDRYNLAFSLKENGYFEDGGMNNDPSGGRILDISASELLFAYPPDTGLLSTLLIGAELTVTIEAPKRTISATARIVRRFKDKAAACFGCRFINMAPEDTRFLFEYLYGRQLDDSDDATLTICNFI